jgi:hypothetical protein
VNERPILPAGIHDGIPAEVYHDDPAAEASLSSSIIKTLLFRSPLHAWWSHPLLNPDFEPKETARFDLGGAAHDAFLQGGDSIIEVNPQDFPGARGGIPEGWTNKPIREERDRIRSLGKLPILTENCTHIRAMIEVAHRAIGHCTDLSGITLKDGKPEQTLIWEEHGVWCRARADWLHNDHVLMLDYKTTDNAEPNSWQRIMTNLMYHVQAAWYLRGLKALTGRDAKWVFLVQEITPPYACSFVGMPPAFLALGNVICEDAVDKWRDCLANHHWPAYSSRIHWAEPPQWLEIQYQERQLQQGLDQE